MLYTNEETVQKEPANNEHATHPCFDKKASHDYGRIHLAVAPKCNIQCNYCDRKFDCINESRPGVTSKVLKPDEALAHFEKAISLEPRIRTIGIAGPGDPFANPEKTLSSIEKISSKYPGLNYCLSTNGLDAKPYLKEAVDLGVHYLTVTLNAVDAYILEKIYSWVRYNKVRYTGLEGAEILLENQIKTIEEAKALGMTIKINSVVLPGINDHHLPEVADIMATYKVDRMNLIPVYPNKKTFFETIEEPGKEMMHSLQSQVRKRLPVMEHCQRCRADAVGLLGQDLTQLQGDVMDSKEDSNMGFTAKEDPSRPNVAVITQEGLLVNGHLGDAEDIFIFNEAEDGYHCVDSRETPAKGSGDSRWEEMGELLNDCKALLVSGIGPKPKSILAESGIEIIEMAGLVDDGLNYVYKGTELKAACAAKPFSCGDSCGGDGMGCG